MGSMMMTAAELVTTVLLCLALANMSHAQRFPDLPNPFGPQIQPGRGGGFGDLDGPQIQPSRGGFGDLNGPKIQPFGGPFGPQIQPSRGGFGDPFGPQIQPLRFGDSNERNFGERRFNRRLNSRRFRG